MPALPQPRFLPGLSWPQADILVLLPPLAAVLAGVYHVLFGPPEARIIEALARRLAAARAPIEAKLVGLLLVLALGAVALGWVGFSALEEVHLRGHRLQIMLDWSGHALTIREELQAMSEAATEPDAAVRRAAMARHEAVVAQTIDHMTRPPAHNGIALAPAALQAFAATYRDHLAAIDAATRRLVAAADAADGTPASLPALHEATLSAQRAQLGLAEQVQGDTQEFQNQTDLQHHGSLIAVMALVGLIAAAGVVLGQAAAVSITRPLGAVTNQLARIGLGDFSPRLALANRDELGDLASRLNAVTAELDRLYSLQGEGKRLAEAFNRELAAKNAELEQARAELEQGKDVLETRVVERTIELEQVHEQLRQGQKLEAIGRLAGGIAHDFNNILTVISGFSELLLAEMSPSDPRRGQIEEIAKAGERAAALTHQLLAFSRRQVLAPEIVDPNSIVADMERLLVRLIGEDIRLVTRLAPDLGRVKADPGQLQQVLLNLAVNARDAMPGGGQLTIETANVELSAPVAPQHVGVAPGPYVMLLVSDTGSGMDELTRTHIFEPFYTTKEQGKGTGLGLATVYGIITQSDGAIRVDSEVGQGATFRIYLPRVEAAAAPHAPPADRRDERTGSETILLVEDEPQVRYLARSVLEARGYTVLEATQPDEAIQHAEQHPGPIDLLLTDVVMPGASGPELAALLADQRPGVPVVYMSGYASETLLGHGLREGELEFLQKPFTPVALAQKVRDVLDARPTSGSPR